jgi:transposase
MGNLLAVNVHAANIHDTKGGKYVFETALYRYPTIIACCADEGYRGTFKRIFEEFFDIRVDISKQIKPKFEVLPKRWRVERTFAWANNSRFLSKDYEISSSSAETIFKISHLHTLHKRL